MSLVFLCVNFVLSKTNAIMTIKSRIMEKGINAIMIALLFILLGVYSCAATYVDSFRF
jgi:hypothetical protein